MVHNILSSFWKSCLNIILITVTGINIAMFPHSALEDFDILQKCKSGTVNVLGNDSYTNTNLLNISQCKFPIKISKKTCCT